jgi:NitT/TauT family transport system permease protein
MTQLSQPAAPSAPPEPAATGRSRSSVAALTPVLYRVGALAVVFAGWWALALWVGTSILPVPTTIAERFVRVLLGEDFLVHMTASLIRVLTALVISLTVATFLGIAMGLSKSAERFFDGIVLGGRTMPGLAWALLAVMIVGVSDGAPILAVSVAVSPLLTLQIWEGTKALDRDLFRMSRVFRVSRGRQFREVVVPAVLPSIVGGAKLGLALSWKVTVLAELFGVTSGVGYEISSNFQRFALDGVLAWALSFAAVMALIEYGLISPVYRRLTRWRGDAAPSPLKRILSRAVRVRQTAEQPEQPEPVR